MMQWCVGPSREAPWRDTSWARAPERATVRFAVAIVAAGTAGPLAACTLREPPAPEGVPSVALPEVAQTLNSTLAPAPSASTALAAPPPSTDSALLPQTRDVPHAAGPAFEARVLALWNAIVKDDPALAMSFFFPLGAYEQVKDVGAPAADWKHRLVEAYARDIRALHNRLGGADAGMVALDVPEGRARWVEPGEEYNKIGYFRVFGSKLRYMREGESHAFDVKSLISWRGEWYVVHLSSIK